MMTYFANIKMDDYLSGLKGHAPQPIDLPVPLIGVDDGYDQIKTAYWALENGQLAIHVEKIKSRARRGVHAHAVGGQGMGVFTTGGEKYTVRDTMNSHEDTRSDDYPKSMLNRVLLHAGLRNLGLGGGQGVAVVTGLPPKAFYSDVSATGVNEKLVEDKTENMMVPVRYGIDQNPGAEILFHGTFPEAIAGMIDYLIDDQGRPREGVNQDQTLMGLDIGGNTTDLVVMAPGNEVLQKETIRFGVSHMRDRLRGLLESKHDLPLDDLLLDQAIATRKMHPFGETKEVDEEWEKAVNDVLVDIFSETERFRKRYPSLSGMVCFGGGAALCSEVIKARYPSVKMMPNPDGANARGFLKMATLYYQETIRDYIAESTAHSATPAAAAGSEA